MIHDDITKNFNFFLSIEDGSVKMFTPNELHVNIFITKVSCISNIRRRSSVLKKNILHLISF